MSASMLQDGSTVISGELVARRSIVALAVLEARRLVSHPVLVLGLAVYVISFPILFAISYADADYAGDPRSAGTYTWPFIGALFVGVFGFVAANRITRSTGRTTGVVDVAPMSEPQRSLALCLACLVPFVFTVLGNLTLLVAWWVNPPVLTEGWAVVTTSEKVWVVVTAALAGLGGPVLGVAVARWWRWPSALAVTTAGLVAWGGSAVPPDTNLALRFWHVSAPYTTPEFGREELGSLWLGGSLEWRFAYICGLIALAAIAAVAHGTTSTHRRRLQLVAVTIGAMTLVTYLLAALTGPATRVIAP
jgi:hypothetical protein